MVLGGGIKGREGVSGGECVQHTIFNCIERSHGMLLLYNE